MLGTLPQHFYLNYKIVEDLRTCHMEVPRVLSGRDVISLLSFPSALIPSLCFPAVFTGRAWRRPV